MLFQGVMFMHIKAKPRRSEMRRVVEKVKAGKCMARQDGGKDCENEAVSIGRCEVCRQVLYHQIRGLSIDDAEEVRTKLVRAGELLPRQFKPEDWGIDTGNTTKMAAASVRHKATA